MTRDLLWIDSRAGLVVGVGLLALGAWLSPWYGLPRELLWAIGVANVGYGLYSGWLFTRQPRPRGAIVALVVANATWALVCLLAVYQYASVASVFGVASLAGEGVFVGALAVVEWRARDRLVNGRARVT
jgi:hypothetical protein